MVSVNGRRQWAEDERLNRIEARLDDLERAVGAINTAIAEAREAVVERRRLGAFAGHSRRVS